MELPHTCTHMATVEPLYKEYESGARFLLFVHASVRKKSQFSLKYLCKKLFSNSLNEVFIVQRQFLQIF